MVQHGMHTKMYRTLLLYNIQLYCIKLSYTTMYCAVLVNKETRPRLMLLLPIVGDDGVADRAVVVEPGDELGRVPVRVGPVVAVAPDHLRRVARDQV